MKIHVLFLGAVTSLTMAACSSDKNGPGAASKYDLNFTPETLGHFEADWDLGIDSKEARADLHKWQTECASSEGYSFNTDVKVGSKFVTRQDNFFLGSSIGETIVQEQTIESIKNDNQFTSIQEQFGVGYSIKSRYKHTAGKGSASSRLVDVISTSPVKLKAQIQSKAHNIADDTIDVSCGSTITDNYKEAVTYATYVLKDGTKVKGILLTESYDMKDLECQYFNDDGEVSRKVNFERVSQETMEFYSKELVNPFTSKCYNQGRILFSKMTKDSSGNRGIISLSKEELIEVSK